MCDYDLAQEIAEKLGVLDNFPQSAKAIVQVGNLIEEICNTDAEANWLLRELTLTGKHLKWGGPGWLKQIHDEHFSPQASPNALPVYELDKSYEPMTDAEREEYATMELHWSKGKPPKALRAEKPAPRELTAEEITALVQRNPGQILESLKAKVLP
jgi:hypothetical protein